MKNPSVNRYLLDQGMDHIDHALGRPVNPLCKSDRNYFATDGEKAERFASSPYWEETGRCRDMRYFRVTDEGRRALKAHLAAIGDVNRPYDVTFRGGVSTVPAPNASMAKYRAWLRMSDAFSDLSFGDFVRSACVRLAA